MAHESDQHIVIQPRKGRKEKTIPEVGILLVNPSEASKCLDMLKESGATPRHLFNSGLVVDKENRFFAAGPALGAPMAALTMEKLIALGAKKLILFGWCGAISNKLKIGGILVPSKAESGEGTSHYYPLEKDAAPAKAFREHIVKALVENGIAIQNGCVWSTDAVYREDRRMLKKLNSEKGVGAIDMEYSALCAVAAFRNIEFAAVLTVSDELWGESWQPGFAAKKFLEQKETTLEILLNFLHRLKDL